jgi:hypothetical protein
MYQPSLLCIFTLTQHCIDETRIERDQRTVGTVVSERERGVVDRSEGMHMLMNHLVELGTGQKTTPGNQA